MTNPDNTAFSNGLTKREYFAAMALQGILSADTKEELKFSLQEVIPTIAVMYADLLIKALNKEENDTTTDTHR